MRIIQRAVLFVVSCFLLYAANLLVAGTTGKITGRVLDQETGKPLPGVNVIIDGTPMGAATDGDGYYFILQVPPGLYTVKAMMIGFEPVEVTRVRVSVGLTTKQDFSLAPTVLEITKGVTLVAERPIVEKDVTFSSHRLSEDQIKNLPTIVDVRDVLARQPGVIGEGLHINVRGGRTGETLYVVDGVSTQSPLYNQATRTTTEQVTLFTSNPVDELASRSGGLSVPANAISEVEVITGGFNAEYGNAMSGVVNIVTKEGGPRHSGRILYLTDDFGGGHFKTPYGNGDGLRQYSQNTDRMEFNLGGPEPISTYLLPALGIKLPEIRYFVSASSYFSDLSGAFDLAYYAPTGEDRSDEDRKIKLFGLDALSIGVPNRMDNRYNTFSNLTMRFSARLKLAYSYQTDRSWYDEYNHAFSLLPENFWQREEEGKGHSLKLTHTLSNKTFYDFVMSYTDQNYLLTPGGMFPDQVRALYDSLGTSAVDLDQDGFYEAGFPSRGTYHKRRTQQYTAKLDVTSQVHQRHQIKTGFEVSRYEMDKGEIKYPQYYNIRWDPEQGGTPPDDGPWPALGAFRDFYHRTPYAGSFYLQDKIEYESLIVNAGFRWDFWAPGPEVDNLIDEGTSIFGTKIKSTFNPRLGISHPITQYDVLYFQFGRFTQTVNYNFLFLQDTQSSGAYKLYGNPNIGAEETTQYEVGLNHAFNDQVKLGVTLFFKDYNGLLNTEQRGREPFTYSVYVNRDFGSSRGIELSLEKRYSHFISGFLNYTFLYATGKSSSYRQGYDYSYRGSTIPIREWPLNWDVRHSLNMNLDFRIPKGEHPHFLGLKLPDRWGLNILWRFETGKPYTPSGRSSDQFTTQNSARLPNRTWVDLKANKDFPLLGMKYSFILEIKNLTNKRNPRAINSESGEVVGFFRAQDVNPSAYGAGRNILMGMALEW